jgi:Phosphotransferase enzyme family
MSAGTLAAVSPCWSSGRWWIAAVGFLACWAGEGRERHGAYVARMAPEQSAMPVFPRYDLPAQFEVISAVAARSDLPLPRLRWNEPDGAVVGTPFFVMDQVAGRVPLDNPPYVFTGWLFEATPEERAQLQRASVAVLAKLHAIAEPAAAFPALRPAGDALRFHVDGQRDYYRWALADDGFRIPIIERSFAWLDEHWPRDPGSDVLSSHGRWMGREWSSSAVYDLTDPAVAGRVPFGVIDHLARARLDGEEGWGMFEHATIGRHDPAGFKDWSSVAPELNG